MARARGSYPRCHWFKSSCRYHLQSRIFPIPYMTDGPVVKRLRLRPFTAATRVRVPSGSPPTPSASSIWRHSSAGRALASHARGHRFEFCCLHQNERTSLRMSFRFGFRSLWSLHPSVVQMLRAAKPPLRNSPPLPRLRIYAPPGAPARRPVGPLFLSRLQQLRAARQMSFSLGAAASWAVYPLLRVKTAPTRAPTSATGASRTNSHSRA